jgi:hypothetical protein
MSYNCQAVMLHIETIYSLQLSAVMLHIGTIIYLQLPSYDATHRDNLFMQLSAVMLHISRHQQGHLHST